MFLKNQLSAYGAQLDVKHVELLGEVAGAEVERFLSFRPNHQPTPLHSLPVLANELGVGSIHIKDEGGRLGLGSFKALGGSYAVIRLVLNKASEELGRSVDIAELQSAAVRKVASGMTFCCATDGNHGRSVALGAQLVGGRSVIFMHSGVSESRVQSMAIYGAEVVRVDGSYDVSVDEAARVSSEMGWTLVSDTSWPGYEYIPGLVMQGYVAMVREILRDIPSLPTHVFLQAGVGGMAASVAGTLAIALGDKRPKIVIVEPERAACVFESARAAELTRIPEREPTVMAMLECYKPSMIGWEILSQVSDAFMTVGEDEAIAVMNRLARPAGNDPAVIAGESGGVGLVGLIHILADKALCEEICLSSDARVLLINSEGATDPERYSELVNEGHPRIATVA